MNLIIAWFQVPPNDAYRIDILQLYMLAFILKLHTSTRVCAIAHHTPHHTTPHGINRDPGPVHIPRLLCILVPFYGVFKIAS